VTHLPSPLQSLRAGHWFKLICGASFQHLPAIRNLTLAYTLAGADCIDVAADPAIVATAREAIAVANQLAMEAQAQGFGIRHDPWLMVSLNDGEDPHFRKAEFNPALCPADCPRPCVPICPAAAIVFNRESDRHSGVIPERCYGCGRCVPICPVQQVVTRSYGYAPEVIAPLIWAAGVDAIEIHTQVGHYTDFKRLWMALAPGTDRLKLVAISCPDDADLLDYLWALHDLITPLQPALIWQTDGRPMSGDIGDGATRACVKLGQKVLAAGLPGFVQLAGGTNRHTVTKLAALGLLAEPSRLSGPCTPSGEGDRPSSAHIAGIAYGSYARSLLAPMLSQLEALATDSAPIGPISSTQQLEALPSLLWSAVRQADELVRQLKGGQRVMHSMS
jgi:Fe-S-cluster-containing hydrogenase component 2